METTTLAQLEQLREETRTLQRQNRALPAFLSITFIPIIVICGWVMFPEDDKGIVFVGKIWIAGKFSLLLKRCIFILIIV